MNIGLIIPSTNVTVEKELEQMLPNFSFATEKVELIDVTAKSLAKMNESVVEAAKCFDNEEVIVSACLVATMMAQGGHEVLEANIANTVGDSKRVISSAGALVRQLKLRGFDKIAMVAPYSDELTLAVIHYLEQRGIEVLDYVNFDETNNELVAQIPTEHVVEAVNSLNIEGVKAIVVSACVQMPSLEAMKQINRGLPLLSAAKATAIEIKQVIAIDS